MVFSSITFLFYFLPLFCLLYYALPWRNAVLLTASLAFYSWGEAENLPILLGSIAGNYACGLAIASAQQRGKKGGPALAVGVVLNLAVLGWFKYANFAFASVADLGQLFGWSISPIDHVALPLGISFFTFHAMSYLVDVYRRKCPPERDPLTLTLYITMFPQLVAGPIIRFSSIAHQLHDRRHTPGRVRLGLEIFILGLAQKVLIANTVALPVDQILTLPADQLTAATAWLAAIGYTLQIYFDFAGYSNMAIGLGLMTGFTFPRNFAHPYISQSVTEFWRRWHMSLSRWFRDYVYIPLGGNRHGPWRTYANLFTVFLLCGLWHGASWTFVVWGAYHGLFLVIERLGLEKALRASPRPLRHVYTLLVVIVGWVFFRCDDFDKALAVLGAMAGFGAGEAALNPVMAYLDGTVIVALIVGAIASTPIGFTLRRMAGRPARRKALGLGEGGGGLPELGTGGSIRNGAAISLAQVVPALFATGALLLLALSMFSLASGTYNPFIYFRF